MSRSIIKPSIVAVGYNRPDSLKRLLDSLSKAHYPNNVDLIISIDHSPSNNCYSIAKDFIWNYGNMEIIHYKTNIGLRKHIINCGQLTSKYECLIILEDDLFVSSNFYNFALQAVNFYKEDINIAGISLYLHNIITNTSKYNFPFIPVQTDYDVFHMKFPSSLGQIWTTEMWESFYSWYKNFNYNEKDMSKLPDSIAKWPESSWKKYFLLYMILKDKYFIYPYLSQVTNFGDTGQHQEKNYKFQSQLNTSDLNKKYSFIESVNTLVKYDQYCEINKEFLCSNKELPREEDFEVDLHGLKEFRNIEKKMVLTSKSVKNIKKEILKFGIELKPIEHNVVFNISGKEIKLVNIDNIKDYKNIKLLKRFDYYYSTWMPVKSYFKLAIYKIFSRIVSKL
ncbi:MAG: glycosyltransferase family 2 protein [bacterium]